MQKEEKIKYDFETIVIGAGHAGVEAALACARSGHKTAIVTLDKNKIALMPCNPSIGGSAKGIVVREIDALGGEMAKAADATALQMKLLNNSRGPAVWAIRAQSDKIAYSQYMKQVLEGQENLTIIETMVQSLLVDENNQAYGIKTEDGSTLLSKVVILTTGTYMRSLTLRGFDQKSEGPDQQRTSNGISDQLANLGFQLVRLKTGTPPRLLRSSIDFSQTKVELGSDLPLAFSHQTKKFLPIKDQLPCYLIYTNAKTHEIINNNLDKSPMYNGTITANGPRYCPSIEDKVVRFADKSRHQIFLEPESTQLSSIYVQGLSTSLAIEQQDQILRTLPGLKDCQVLKWAYAIEYDAIDPRQLWPSLETKIIKNFFTAGQINGTSGYEEAACQGLIAGINAHLKLTNQEPLILKRDEAYIGVLIDDLTTKGNGFEPYRLLTSLAEYRLLLRNDNAQTRLINYGYHVGLVTDKQLEEFKYQQNLSTIITAKLQTIKVNQSSDFGQFLTTNYQTFIPDNGISCFELVKRPEIKLEYFKTVIPEINDLNYHQNLELEISIKFAGYIKQQEKNAQQMLNWETKQIPKDIDYDLIDNITLVAKEKLQQIRPLTIAHATRIPGITPSDIHMLLFFLKNKYPYLNAN
ncbi:MAG: tRNA uridine-5-carboxymethylaminomethyl(34) synthesis enzyme MnmG [Spiroplasma sp.]|nr:tRNA uridine-5-carboxymethylaminomethyl(34) synthesis enzyme MnmG [Spiroplasma sp.]